MKAFKVEFSQHTNLSRFSEARIMGILRQAESSMPVTELCREHGMSNASFYKWRSKFGSMDASMMVEMKSIAEECRRLIRMYAEMSMQIRSLINC